MQSSDVPHANFHLECMQLGLASRRDAVDGEHWGPELMECRFMQGTYAAIWQPERGRSLAERSRVLHLLLDGRNFTLGRLICIRLCSPSVKNVPNDRGSKKPTVPLPGSHYALGCRAKRLHT